jgi:hypothetical protein
LLVGAQAPGALVLAAAALLPDTSMLKGEY